MEQPQETLLDQLFAKQEQQQSRRRNARKIVREEEAVLETNRHGTMRWYVHPSFEDLVDRNTLIYRYEIEPHGATGKQHRQGNMVSYVTAGHGYTELNGVKHYWEPGDVIGIPPLPLGVVFQHVNESDETAILVTAEPNYYDMLGVGVGSTLEQLEDAPHAVITSDS